MSTGLEPSNGPANPPDPAPHRRSGGPRTAEGKERSRRNALKRGLRSRIVFPDDLAELIDQRVIAFAEELAPATAYEEMLVRDMAVASARFERCASLAVADLVRSVDRAELCWEEDRRMAIEIDAARLAREPERVARGLRQSRQGTDWLIEHWEALAAIAREAGRWDDDQRRLALDLLGVPRELRPGAAVVPDGEDAAALIDLAESQIEALRCRREDVLDDLDDAERAMATAGMPLEEDAATRRLRRDESRARNDFARALNELLRYRAERAPGESPPRPEPSMARPRASVAAMNHLVERTRRAERHAPPRCEAAPIDAGEMRGFAQPEPPAVTASPPERPRSRRARKELARRARAAARRSPAMTASG